MKTLLTFLTSLFLLTSCTGGAESIVGGATVVDYIPFALMVSGLGLAAFGGYKKIKNKEVAGTEIAWGLILLVFGIIVYFVR